MKLEKDYKLFTAAFGIVAISSLTPLAAEEAQPSEPVVEEAVAGELEPYVVVSTRTPLSLDRISPSVDYISSEEIEFWQDRDLVDTLSRQPGMTLITSGGTGSQTSLFTRGTESNHTAFFMDGRRMNIGFGNQYNLEYLNVGNASSVQVQRGASSVNYGSSGIGGVVDVQSESGLGQSEATGAISGEIGSNDYKRGAFSTSYGTDQYGISLSGSALSTDNERKNDDFESSYLNSRFDYMLTDTLSVELVGMYAYTEKGLPNSIYSPSVEDNQDTTNWLVSPGIRYATDELSAHLFYSRSESKAELDQVKEAFSPVFPWPSLGFYPVSNDIEVESDEVNLQIDYSVSDDMLVTVGGVYREDDASNTNLNTFNPLDPAIPYSNTFEQTGGYAQMVWLLGDFEVRTGVRYDDYSEFDDQTTGSGELVYQLNDIDAALFAKVASSYAPPGAADIAFDSDAATELQPEESVSYELGWRQSLFSNTLNYSVVLFHNDIDELIDYVYNPDTFGFDSVNVEEATTEGVEVQVVYTAIKDLELSVGYTYLTAVADYQDDPRTEFDFGNPDPASDVRLARRPRHMLQLSAIYQFTDQLSAGIQGVGHFDREDVNPESYLLEDADDYFVGRLVADFDLTESWTLFARVENLFDEEYEPAGGFPALGRAGFIGARWNY